MVRFVWLLSLNIDYDYLRGVEYTWQASVIRNTAAYYVRQGAMLVYPTGIFRKPALMGRKKAV